jgi:hypothetical protein
MYGRSVSGQEWDVLLGMEGNLGGTCMDISATVRAAARDGQGKRHGPVNGEYWRSSKVGTGHVQKDGPCTCFCTGRRGFNLLVSHLLIFSPLLFVMNVQGYLDTREGGARFNF